MDPRRIAERAALAAMVVGAALCVWGRVEDATRRQAGAREVAAQAERLGDQLQTAISTTRMRAEALAALPVVRAAVETDAATVRDLAKSSSFFAPKASEALALYQVPRARLFLPLYRVPERGPALPAGEAGAARVTTLDDGLEVAITVRVDPMYDHGALTGALVLATQLPLAALRARLESLGVAATLEGLDQPLPLANVKPDGPLDLAANLPVPPLPGLTVRARVVTHLGARLRTIGWLVLALAALAFLALKIERTRQRPPVLESAPASHDAEAVDLSPERDEEPRETRRLVLVSDDAPLPQLVPRASDPQIVTPAPPERGEALDGRYRIFQHLGAGSAGDVYLAQSAVPGPTVVALKILRPSSVPLAEEKFRALAERTATLSHEHVARLHDFGVSGGSRYLAMEYVEGCSLAGLLAELEKRDGAMPLNQSLRVLEAVCRGLDAAHAHGIVHGDLKPSNVLVGRHGAVKVGDFPPGGGLRLSEALAPELRLGREADARTDVFAVGTMLRDLTAGQPAPRRLEAIVRKALQPSPRRRFASCRALADALFTARSEAQAPPAGELEDWVERVRRSM